MKKNMKAIISILFLFFLFCMFCLSLIIAQQKSLIFSHQLHIDDIGAECEDCHITIPESQNADDRNLPTHDECFICHDDDTASQECKTCHIDPDAPQALPDLPIRDNYFSHVFHIEEQEMECTDCHKGLEETDYAQKENFPSMEQCFGCHDDLTAPKRCESCHTPESIIIPQSHNADWLIVHKHTAKVKESECMTCHEDNYCEDCHTGSRLLTVGNGDKDYVSPEAPSSEGKSTMAVKRVHNLNYRYTHSIEANDKRLDCSLCHEQSQFCVRCHQEDEKIQYLKPSWHSGPDWGAIVEAVGSGGGRHAQLAKRDIEKCAACHDSQGEDPTCIMCHRDFLPGRGNDLRTHSIGMFSGAGDGVWHVDEGSICFNCHTDTRTAGIGFCGYCHGLK